MQQIKEFLKDSKKTFNTLAYKRIKEALTLSVKLLEGRKRYNGDDFILHSVGVAHIVLKDMNLDEISVTSAILHDISRFDLMPNSEIEKQFGKDVAEVLYGMKNISDVNTNMSSNQVEYFKDMIISYSTNPRIILLKVADRTEVMRSLEAFPPKKRAKKSWESLYIYSQIAHKLGYYVLKSEMEDLALKYLEPDDYNHIKESLENSEKERDIFINSFIEPIRDGLDKKKINFKIKGRTKSIYSIWKKMTTQKISFSEVYDIFAIRVVIDCPLEEEKSLCWLAYSIVTDFYNPNPKRMRDWISIPKSSGYESLHITVVTPGGHWVEVQIRSSRMDDVAENGMAAHWRYKGVKDGKESSQEWLDRVKNVIENVGLSEDNISLSDDLSLENKEVFVFTPTGDLRKLREGATILDFAYDIHSDIGDHCIAGKINHRNVTIRDRLSSGDLVEIITSRNQKPRADWLNIVVTSKAKSRIKAFLRESLLKESVVGKEELERKIKNWKLGIDLDRAVVILTKHYKFKNGIELYQQIASDSLSMIEVKSILSKYISGELTARVTEERQMKVKEERSNSNLLIVGEGIKGIQYKLSSCCSPLYGDEIFGFVTILHGITIHRKNCVNGKNMIERYPYRVIEAAWQGSNEIGKREIIVDLESDENISTDVIKGICQNIGVELRSVNTEFIENKIKIKLHINVTNISLIDSVLYLFRQLNGVTKCRSTK